MSDLCVFRMCAGIKMERDIVKGEDFCFFGDYEMVIDGKKIQFDFETVYVDISTDDPSVFILNLVNPLYDEYPELKTLSKDMFLKVSKVTSFHVCDHSSVDGQGLKPISLEYLAFVFPNDNWEKIPVSKKVFSEVCFEPN